MSNGRPRPVPDSVSPSGYVELVRTNVNFRRLWGGNIVSLFGDWFNTIAIYRLIEELTGSPLALGAVFITKMLPLALASPVAGLIVDRWNRRRVMIGADLIRAVVVLGFLLVGDAADVWLIYALTALQVTISAVFNPAKSASIPNIVPGQDLLTANALMSATWSTMLAIGAAVGGLAVEALGPQAVFVIDSATYLVSAWFIWRTVIPQDTEAAEPTATPVRDGLRTIVEGWRRMRERPSVGRIALAKAAWGIGGGAPVFMLVLLAEALMPDQPALGIGLLYSARGLGTGLGPILARAWLPDAQRWPALLGVCMALSGLGYILISQVGWLWVVVPLVIFAHAASGANWVLSTVLLQQRTEDRFRGRVFATDWLLVTLVESASVLAAALLLEYAVASLGTIIFLFASVQVLTGFVWLLTVVPAERRHPISE
ncbi:MAG: MFS transporter [Rhodothermales bacterium]